MKLIRTTPCLFVAMLFFCQSMAAQNQVIVTVSISPPYSHRFADYTQYQNQVFLSLTNTTQQDLQMKVLCEITGQGSGFHIKTKVDYVPNQIISLAPGETRQFNGNGITGYLDRNNTEDNIPGDVEAEILRTGLLPQDVYDYCIEVVDINTLEVLGRRCTVIPIQYLTPPQPNLPWCGESQNLLNNPSINFSWLPSTGSGMGNANLRYDFYIVPVPAGQDPAQLLDLAMDGQMPGQSFVVPNLVSTYLPYTTPTYPPLKPGAYVWGIVAHDLNKQVGIENDGKSQFCTLTLLSGDVDNEGVADQMDNAGNLDKCSCQSPAQAPGGPTANELLQVGTTIKVGAYDMYIKSLSGQGAGAGRISVPGFPGGISVPVLVDFTGLTINSDRKMMTGLVTAQLKSTAGFLPEVADPNLATLPLGQDQITQLDNYFAQNAEQLVSSMGSMVDESGFQLPLGLDKYVGGQKVIVAITGLYFDATRAALDAAVVLNLVEAGTKIALSGRNICLKDGLGLCGEAELYLAENLSVPAINLTLRGLKEAPQASQCTRVEFDKDGFKRLHIEALYTFSDQLLSKAAGGGPVVATLVADTEEGWSDWMASVTMDDFRIKGINDFTFRPGTSSYDHSTKANPANMPGDYTEGQTPTWTGFFLKTLQVDLPPIIRNRNSNQPLSGAATNVIIDGNGVTGTLSLNNLLAIGDGGNGNWQFSVDRFAVKFLKNTFQSGGFEGRLLLPITNRGAQSQLNYSSLLSYANNQFSYNFVVQPKSDIEVDLFALLFELYNTSTITVSYTAQNGFNANANLDGKFSVNTKTFSSELPDMQLAHLEFSDFVLTTSYPYVKYGQLNAGLASPPKSVGGFPFTVNGWAIVSDGNGIGLQANINLKLSDVGFLPNASTTIAFYGNIDQNGPKFNKFALKKIHVDGDFSVLHIDGDLEFFSRDGTWGDGFTGNMNTRFPPNITLNCRMQVGNKNGQNYWYVDGQSHFSGKSAEFLAGLNAFGFSGGAFYNMSPNNFQLKGNVTSTEDPANFNNPGQAPSGTGYVFDVGKCGIKASIILGLPTKSLFNSNASLEVVINHNDGGVVSFRFNGAARMFGEPGSDGLAKGTLDVGYDFPHKIMVLGVGFGLDLPALPVKAQGWLGIYANGTNGDWHFKVGRPLGYGDENQRVKASIDAWAIKVSAIAYFQCGNYDVDGLPKQLPPLMSQIFPNYRNDYAQFASLSRAGANGDAILVGLSVGFTFRATYLIIYGQLDAETGFDLLLRKGVSCNGVPAGIGKDAWYGTGRFYVGMAVSLGITIDLFFISGDFEILKIGFGGLLDGGGPNPTWMKGTVGGFYSILGGLVEGNAKFDFAVGERCIDASDALSKIKIFNDVSPETLAPDDPMVPDSQSVLVSPAAATNLRIGRTFALDQTLPNGDTLLRVFRLSESDLSAEFTKMDGTAQKFDIQFAEDEFGISLNKTSALNKRTWYKVKFMASLSECPSSDVVPLGRDQNLQPNGYCSSNNWQTAKIKDKNTGKVNDFKETRELRFVTNDGLDSIPPDHVIYTIPHRGQRFFCHWDVAQVLIALKEQLPVSAFKAPDGVVPVVKMRFVPSGMSDDEALPAGDVTLMSLPYDDPALAVKNVFGNYVATKGKYYYLGQQPGGLLSPNTVYGIQYFIEWPKAPNAGGQQQAQNIVRTTVVNRLLAAGQGTVHQRELTAQKYLLGKNQHQIYRYYFRTGSYPTFAGKMKDLELKELIVKELLWGANASKPRKTISIVSPEVDHPDQIVARIKAEFSAEHWSGSNYSKGIYIPGANFDGPENFDVFDVKGFETGYMDGIYKKSVKVLPLIDIDNSLTRSWWRDFLFETLMILGYNGIKENVPYDKFPNWTFAAPTLKVNRIAGPIAENAALGNVGGPPPNMAVLLYQNNNLNGLQSQYNNSLVEVFRFVLDASLDVPGVINPKNQVLGNIIKNQWISDPTPINVDQWSTNIGKAYDHLSQAGGPGFNLQDIGSSLGPLKVNAIQPAGVPVNTLNLGKKR